MTLKGRGAFSVSAGRGRCKGDEVVNVNLKMVLQAIKGVHSFMSLSSTFRKILLPNEKSSKRNELLREKRKVLKDN